MDDDEKCQEEAVGNSGDKPKTLHDQAHDGIDTDLKLKVGEAVDDVDTESGLGNGLVTADGVFLEENLLGSADNQTAPGETDQREDIHIVQDRQISDCTKISEDGMSTQEQTNVDKNDCVNLEAEGRVDKEGNATQLQGTELSPLTSNSELQTLQVQDSDDSQNGQDVEMSADIVDSKELADLNTDSNSICDLEIHDTKTVQSKQLDNDTEAQNIQSEDKCNIDEKSVDVANIALSVDDHISNEATNTNMDTNKEVQPEDECNIDKKNEKVEDATLLADDTHSNEPVNAETGANEENVQPEGDCGVDEKNVEVENVAVPADDTGSNQALSTKTSADEDNLQPEVDSHMEDKNAEVKNMANLAIPATGSDQDINLDKDGLDKPSASQVDSAGACIVDKCTKDSDVNLGEELLSNIPSTEKTDDDILKATEDVVDKVDDDVNEDDILRDNEESMEFKTTVQGAPSDLGTEVDVPMETEQTKTEDNSTICIPIDSEISDKNNEENETNSENKDVLEEDVSLAKYLQSENTEDKDIKVNCDIEGKTEGKNELNVGSEENVKDSAADNLEKAVVESDAAAGEGGKQPVSMEMDPSESGDNVGENKDNEAAESQPDNVEDQDTDDIKIIDVITPNDKPKEIINLDDDEEDDTMAGSASGEAKDSGTNLQISSVTSEKQISKDRETDAKNEELKNPQSQGKIGGTPTKTQKCIVCARVGKCKYNIVRNGDIKHLCDDVCFKRFRSSPTTFLRASSPARSQEKSTPAPKAPPSVPANDKQTDANKSKTVSTSSQQPPFKTCSVCQLMNVNTSKPFLNWLGLDFCREECLGKFQSDLNSTCAYCAGGIANANKAKFCSKVGSEVKNFCSTACYTEFKKRQKVCSFCQKDLSLSPDSFMAPVGPQGTFKDFCTQACLQSYEEKSSKDIEIMGVDRALKSKTVPEGDFTCSVCSKTGPAKHEIKLEGKMHRLCSDPCLSAFQYANKLTMNTCDNCGVYCYCEGTQPQYIQYEGHQKRFCSFMCINTFKSLNKKIISCAWCGSKKSNFDMIERVDQNNKYQLFCSLNCLSLYRVNLQATSNQAVTCDQCRKFVPAQYHLTMSDASVRNFCSYNCVMSFQGQFTAGTKSGTQQKQTPPQKPPVATQSKQVVAQPRQTVVQQKTVPQTQQRAQLPPAQPKMSPSTKYGTRSSTRQAQQVPTTTSIGSFPIISNVVSLAPQTKAGMPQIQTVNLKSTTPVPVIVSSQSQNIKTTAPITTQTSVQQQIIIQPPPPKSVKNKSLLCKPFVQTKATSCRPHTQTKSVQTDGDSEPKKYFIPVPVPIYVPVPMAMYSMPTPFPLPVPIPVGVPCFIPTTRKSAKGIAKSIKEILEKIPSDPLEAELLMMAEAVASVPKKTDSDSSDDDGGGGEGETSTAPDTAADDDMPQSETVQEGNGFGEDMLQMALRMASEMDSEPVMDLEASLEPVPVNTDPPLKPDEAASTSPIESDEEYVPTRETRSKGRGMKRQVSGRGKKNKRAKVEGKSDIREENPLPPSPPTPVAPPDAHMCLKYTYGINAWKHWVIQKNAQLEKVSKSGSSKLKLFKTELLQCSADELNYSLCLFVKEVRKPNGEEYAPDSVFYLCLGIQSYVFENGRVDNIFTDMYYEKFTECLNDVLGRYEPKINTAGQLVCRIEEEQLWESKQLGAHSPHVLLNTLVYFNTKYFMLKTTDDHMKLSFTHIMKHFKKSTTGKGLGPNMGRSVFLRYFCPTNKVVDNFSKKKNEGMPVYEQAENLDNPLRCPVKLYEFYLSKCSSRKQNPPGPDSTKNRNDTFYMAPERSCVPDSPVWYSTQALSNEAMTKMLNRIRLVREIQEAHLHTQPIYI